MEKGEQERWERTAKWALENIAEAQYGMTDKVELQLTFKSQDDSDIEQYMQQVEFTEQESEAEIMGMVEP